MEFNFANTAFLAPLKLEPDMSQKVPQPLFVPAPATEGRQEVSTTVPPLPGTESVNVTVLDAPVREVQEIATEDYEDVAAEVLSDTENIHDDDSLEASKPSAEPSTEEVGTMNSPPVNEEPQAQAEKVQAEGSSLQLVDPAAIEDVQDQFSPPTSSLGFSGVFTMEIQPKEVPYRVETLSPPAQTSDERLKAMEESVATMAKQMGDMNVWIRKLLAEKSLEIDELKAPVLPSETVKESREERQHDQHAQVASEKSPSQEAAEAS